MMTSDIKVGSIIEIRGTANRPAMIRLYPSFDQLLRNTFFGYRRVLLLSDSFVTVVVDKRDYGEESTLCWTPYPATKAIKVIIEGKLWWISAGHVTKIFKAEDGLTTAEDLSEELDKLNEPSDTTAD